MTTINGWVQIHDAPSPKTSDKKRTEWCKTLEGTELTKNGQIRISHRKTK